MNMELFGPLAATAVLVGAVFYLFRMLQASDMDTAEKSAINSEDK